jgi:hypothetical protein
MNIALPHTADTGCTQRKDNLRYPIEVYVKEGSDMCYQLKICIAMVLTTVFSIQAFGAGDYDEYLGSWDGTWKSSQHGDTGNISVSCRRGSSLGPNCTYTMYRNDNTQETYPITPDLQSNGTLHWEEGLFDYKFNKPKNNKMKITYKVIEDRGVWNVKKR